MSEKILVDIEAAGVSPLDWKIREGYMQKMMPIQFPATLGMDFSGIIKEIGSTESSIEFKIKMKSMDKFQ